MKNEKIVLTEKEWDEEGLKRYGKDKTQWVFQCPMCKVKTKVQEWLDADAENMAAFSCIGRTHDDTQSAFFTKNRKPVGCDLAGGGLFQVNPIHVVFLGGIEKLFDFADDPLLSLQS